MRVFLGAHHAGFAVIRVEQHGGLLDLAAIFDGFDLPADFVFNGLLQVAEAVQVLHLAARAERLAGAAHGDVGVAAEGAFLQVAVADADPLHECVQGLGVGYGFGGTAHVRLGDDFEQWGAGAVEVDTALAPEIFVQALAGIFFKVRARQVHDLGVSLVAFAHLDGDFTALYDRQFELADLVALGQIGVEVILARKHRARCYLCANGQTEADGAFDSPFVEHGQHAGQGDIHRAGLHVRLGAKRSAGTREDFRGGIELDVGFQTDDDFPIATHE